MGGSQAEREQRVTPLELFFDLVFFSAFAWVMTFLSHESPARLMHESLDELRSVVLACRGWMGW